MRRLKSLASFCARWIGEDDDSSRPIYDPVHLAAVLVGSLAALGALYWLLWTLLVYDGGLFSKVLPFFHVLIGSKTLADYGYYGSPYQMGAFRGWMGNLGALIILVGIIIVLYRGYQEAAGKAKEDRESR
jgi:hypothetical protein